jgi:hypothetical protein
MVDRQTSGKTANDSARMLWIFRAIVIKQKAEAVYHWIAHATNLFPVLSKNSIDCIALSPP